MGIILLVSMAMVTDYTVILLIKDGILANKFTYQVLGHRAGVRIEVLAVS